MVTQSDIVYVVDGIWDSITLNFLGFPCISLMGSRVSEYISKILALYKRLILVADNDKAGVDLFIDLSKSLFKIEFANYSKTVGCKDKKMCYNRRNYSTRGEIRR